MKTKTSSLNAFNSALHQAALPRAKAAAEMRASGMKWVEVGDALGVSRQRAFQLAAMYAASRR